MTSTNQIEEQRLLDEINRHLPEGVDWKSGALTYLRELNENQGIHSARYHLIKPFLGGPDFQPFLQDLNGFLNYFDQVDLPMRSSVLDVACGPGWVSHYLAKLGYNTLGLDISDDMIALARQRLASEPYSVFCNSTPSSEFLVHDIEDAPLPSSTQFDAAILVAALHHFYNPIRALHHIAQNLKPDGTVFICEGVAPSEGSPSFLHNLSIMKQYKTLERPFSREQLQRILELTGFRYFQFFDQINGFFDPESPLDTIRLKQQRDSGVVFNAVMASRTPEFLIRRIVSRNAPITTLPVIEFCRKLPCFGVFLRKCLVFLKLYRDSRSNPKDIWFLVELYRHSLGRNPDDAGLRHFMSELSGGRSRVQIIRDFMRSAEFQQRMV